MTGVASDDVEISPQDSDAHLAACRLHFREVTELLRDWVVAYQVGEVARDLSAAADDVNQTVKRDLRR